MADRLLQEEAGQLISHEYESTRLRRRVRRKSMCQESTACAPVSQGDQNRRERDALADLDADVEADDVGAQAVLRQPS